MEDLIHVFLIYLQLTHQNAICLSVSKVAWAFISQSLKWMLVGIKFSQGNNFQSPSYFQNQDFVDFK